MDVRGKEPIVEVGFYCLQKIKFVVVYRYGLWYVGVMRWGMYVFV